MMESANFNYSIIMYNSYKISYNLFRFEDDKDNFIILDSENFGKIGSRLSMTFTLLFASYIEF